MIRRKKPLKRTPLKRKFYKIKKGKPLKRTPIKRKARKATGELALFLSLWEQRPHVCINCKVHLQEFNVSFFSHIKSKGAHPDLRLDPDNISILCLLCHIEYDQGIKERFAARFRL